MATLEFMVFKDSLDKNCCFVTSYLNSSYSETTSTGATEDFQPIRNRSLNKEINVLTSRETVIFFDWSVSILNFWPSSKGLRIFFTAEMQTVLILLLQ